MRCIHSNHVAVLMYLSIFRVSEQPRCRTVEIRVLYSLQVSGQPPLLYIHGMMSWRLTVVGRPLDEVLRVPGLAGRLEPPLPD